MNAVMIVDDEECMVQVASSVLKMEGYNVVAAANGLECLSHMRDGFHGLILMDIAMPELDGWETIRMLREERLLDGSLVCMFTGLEPDGGEAGLEDCVFDYLAKPFTGAALLEMVSSSFECLNA